MPVTHFRGLSVTESGFMVGAKGSELPLFPDTGIQRMRGGTTGFSGYTTISTNISTVSYVFANLWSLNMASGHIGVKTDWSGWTIGLTTIDGLGGAAASGQVVWLAIGQ